MKTLARAVELAELVSKAPRIDAPGWPLPDSAELWVDSPGKPFHGLTEAKARMVNDVFTGLRVIVAGGHPHGDGQNRLPREYMFLRMLLPQDFRGGLIPSDYHFAGVGDLRLAQWDRRDGRAHTGTIRNLSASLVDSFETVAAPELSPCWQCGSWCPHSELTDITFLFADEPPIVDRRLECRPCSRHTWS